MSGNVVANDCMLLPVADRFFVLEMLCLRSHHVGSYIAVPLLVTTAGRGKFLVAGRFGMHRSEVLPCLIVLNIVLWISKTMAKRM